MIHQMRLKDDPFFKIWEGKKTIELRLLDEKRQKICVGDTIEFTRLSVGTERIVVSVVGIHVFDSFAALYATLPLDRCGYDQATMKDANPSDMEAYYSVEEQNRYGVVGIEFDLIERKMSAESVI